MFLKSFKDVLNKLIRRFEDPHTINLLANYLDYKHVSHDPSRTISANLLRYVLRQERLI